MHCGGDFRVFNKDYKESLVTKDDRCIQFPRLMSCGLIRCLPHSPGGTSSRPAPEGSTSNVTVYHEKSWASFKLDGNLPVEEKLVNVDAKLGDTHRFKLGQLKLNIQAKNNSLSIHLIEAHYLNCKRKELCDSYVQVSLCPDESLHSRWNSQTVTDSNSPVYNETCTIELLPGDSAKRLLISVWHADSNKNCSEFLGCMSFGMRHLIVKAKKKTGLTGLYYLLPEDLGCRKHLLVSRPNPQGLPNALSVSCGQNSKTEDSIIPELNRKLQGLETHTMVIYKSGSGYGFTVKGECPVRIGRVKTHGPAERAGLKKGDYIIRINGENVSRSSADSVAAIVRQSTKFVVLDICHPPAKSTSDDHSHQYTSSQVSSVHSNSISSIDTLSTQMRSSVGQSAFSISSEEHQVQDENIPPYSKLSISSSRKGHVSLQSAKEMSVEKRISKQENLILGYISDKESRNVSNRSSPKEVRRKKQKICSKERTPIDGQSDTEESYTKWDPYLSLISDPSALHGQRIISQCDLQSLWQDETSQLRDSKVSSGSDSLSEWNQWLETSVRSRPCGSPVQPPNSEASYQSREHKDIFSFGEGFEAPNCSLVDASELAKITKSYNPCDRTIYSGSPDLRDTSLLLDDSQDSIDETSIHDDDLDNDPREAAILRLVHLEHEFSQVMQHGIQQFSRPLRHGILSSEQHMTLFQNIEKLVALSEYHTRHLLENSYCAEDSQHPSLPDNLRQLVGDVYKPTMRLLSSTYKTYICGLPAALKLLHELQQKKEFIQFVQKCKSSAMTVEEFLICPQHHLAALLRSITLILQQTPKHHEDHMLLETVFNTIESECHSVMAQSI